jgi:hypothetical protein
VSAASEALDNGVAGHRDLDVPAEVAYALICAVEKWPVWLSFVESARLSDERRTLALGSDVVVRSRLLGLHDQIFEVDDFVAPHRLSLVDAFSVRRRIDFRIVRRGERSRITARIAYPIYLGSLGTLLDRAFVRGKLEAALDASLVHFQGLVEYDSANALEDF